MLRRSSSLSPAKSAVSSSKTLRGRPPVLTFSKTVATAALLGGLVELDRRDVVRGGRLDEFLRGTRLPSVRVAQVEQPGHVVAVQSRLKREVAMLALLVRRSRGRGSMSLPKLVRTMPSAGIELTASSMRSSPWSASPCRRSSGGRATCRGCPWCATTPSPLSAWVSEVSRCWPSSSRNSASVPVGSVDALDRPGLNRTWSLPVLSSMTTPCGCPRRTVTSSCRMRSSSHL